MFVVVGEALVDLVGQRGDRTFSAHPGGSPANVALGLARLGVAVTLKTRLGRDVFGEMILARLEASGVRVDGGADEDAKTSLAIAALAAGIASYDFRIDWDVEELAPLPVETRCLHTGSLATVLPPGKANVVDLVEREHKRGRVTVSYDPNIRLASGPALVVVTRGGSGLYAVSAGLELRRGAVPIDLVDTVGAGDSFTAGLLDGLHRADLVGGARREALAAIDEATLGSVVDAAALIAAITCSRPGADPPTRAEVDAALAAGPRA